MRQTWIRMRWLSLALIASFGCWSTGPKLKPPPAPEEYRKPPDDDARFSSPIAYPKDTLNQDMLKKNQIQDGPGVGGSPGQMRPSSMGTRNY